MEKLEKQLEKLKNDDKRLCINNTTDAYNINKDNMVKQDKLIHNLYDIFKVIKSFELSFTDFSKLVYDYKSSHVKYYDICNELSKYYNYKKEIEFYKNNDNSLLSVEKYSKFSTDKVKNLEYRIIEIENIELWKFDINGNYSNLGESITSSLSEFYKDRTIITMKDLILKIDFKNPIFDNIEELFKNE